MHVKRLTAAAIGLWLAAAGLATAAPIRALDGRALAPAAIDGRVRGLMRANDVKGLALALIRDGRVVYVRTYGLRDVERDLPLEPDTVMYAASLTKATFAYMVMQLVDEGKVDLDRSIADYLPKPLPAYPKYADLAGDERWRRLTPRILLDHTTGFQNFRWLDPDGKLRFHRDPGTRYGYSGEGVNLMQFVLEQGLGLDVGQEMQRRVFDRFGMTRTSMLWRADFAANVANGYTADGKLQPHDRRENVRAAGSMDTTIADWSRFLAGVARGEGLSAKAKAEMIRLQVPIDSVRQFPTLAPETTDENKAVRLGYGVGWGVFETPFGHAYFKEGHDDGTRNYGLCVEPRRACIVLMSNSDRTEGIYKALVDELMGDVGMPWRWENYIPYDLAAKTGR
ncbi:serine hydrolase [Caulobacter sp. CCUG 60055]|uniref:serine hydrolase domain-containing protein n=1 Tax=Caulobacter sp. CCUG 60055 TaxID=2100090 RepID=UPI001FA810FF|nr:serine hydrolase domain-containing protein [Caulobacter sp. CCUG 60055]MCI3180088.1 serine hydrolase [Caulobacter sp. CCUG 60055]